MQLSTCVIQFFCIYVINKLLHVLFCITPCIMPLVPVSARVRIICHIYTKNNCITHVLSCMWGSFCCRCVIKINYYMSYSVSHIAKVGGVNRNAAWRSFVRVHNVAVCLRHNQNYARDNQDYFSYFSCIAL